MNIEHIGIMVQNPVEMGKWYEDNLGFNILKSSDEGDKGVAFITDTDGNVMLEFGKTPSCPPLDLASLVPLQIHIAFKSDDPFADSERLQKAGAVFVKQCGMPNPEDVLLLLLDPWGVALQLVKRAEGIGE